MGGNRGYFPKIAIYRPGMFVRCIPVTARWGFMLEKDNMKPE